MFITSKAKKAEAERWLDNTFNYFLQSYGAKMCAKAFNKGDESALPRREERQKVTTFMSSYIKSLNLQSSIQTEESVNLQPPKRKSKKRAMVVYGDGDDNVWMHVSMHVLTSALMIVRVGVCN